MKTQPPDVDQLRRRFLAVVSHELRTPLASIQAALGLLDQRRAELPPQARELVAIARRNGERLTRLVEDILDLQRVESGRMRFFFSRCSVDTLLEQAIADQRAVADAAGVGFTVRDRAPGLAVRADRQRLVQAVGCVIASAVRTSPDGGSVTVVAEPSGRRLRIAVQGAGDGRTAIDQRLFDVPAWGDAPAEQAGAGFGLGLALARAMIEGMEGSFSVACGDGGATTVAVELPAWEEETAAEEASAA